MEVLALTYQGTTIEGRTSILVPRCGYYNRRSAFTCSLAQPHPQSDSESVAVFAAPAVMAYDAEVNEFPTSPTAGLCGGFAIRVSQKHKRPRNLGHILCQTP